MIAQKDIALKLGISRTAVSAILGGGARSEKFRPEMREKVLQAAGELGYQHNELARAIRTGKNNVIGFVTQRMKSFVGRMLAGVLDVMETDYFIKVISLDHNRDAESLVRQCVGQCMSGVIMYDIAEPEFLAEAHRLLAARSIPLVIAGGNSNVRNGTRIVSDCRQGGRLAFEYLYGLGHRKFALPTNWQWTDYNQGLQAGFAEAAGEAGIDIGDQRFYQFHDTFEFGAFYEYFQKHRPTGLFCGNDFVTLKVITALQQQGIRVPDDVSVIGRGNLDFCESCSPEITSLDEGLSDIGERAAKLLKERIGHNNDVPYVEYHPHRLVVRKSATRKGGIK